MKLYCVLSLQGTEPCVLSICKDRYTAETLMSHYKGNIDKSGLDVPFEVKEIDTDLSYCGGIVYDIYDDCR